MITKKEILEELETLKEYCLEDEEITKTKIYLNSHMGIISIKIKEGYTYDLAKENIWPFTEYIREHRVKIVIPPDYPRGFPILTWLTDINHPNIIPKKRNRVCVKGIEENWQNLIKLWPEEKLLPYFCFAFKGLLKNPWPILGWGNTEKQIEALRVCTEYGFPKVWPPPSEEKKGVFSMFLEGFKK